MNLLSYLILIPLITAVTALLMRNAAQVKVVSLIGAFVQLGMAIFTLFSYNAQRQAGNKAQMLFENTMAWFPTLGINYHVGIDGISLAMILLTPIFL